MPLFSIVVPTFNRAKLIGQTLQSILFQECADFELIVVDDGSIDETVRNIKAFGDRIRLFEQQNRGPGAARNVGIEHAQGDYIAFLDSDDVWFPWTLKIYAAVIHEYARPAIVIGKPSVFESEDEVPPRVDLASASATAFLDYFTSGDEWRWWGVSSFVIRRDALQATRGFLSDRVNSEDADLMLQLGTARGFVQITGPATFGYRNHCGNLISNLDKTLAGVRRIVREEWSGAYPGGVSRSFERRRIISRHLRPVSLDLLSRGRRADAWELYWSSFRWHLREYRWRYLLGFPAVDLRTRWRPKKSSIGAMHRPAA